MHAAPNQRIPMCLYSHHAIREHLERRYQGQPCEPCRSNATEVSAGIPDGCMGHVRDGLDSLLDRALDYQVSIIRASSATATRLNPLTETATSILWVAAWAMSDREIELINPRYRATLRQSSRGRCPWASRKGNTSKR